MRDLVGFEGIQEGISTGLMFKGDKWDVVIHLEDFNHIIVSFL